MLIPSVCLAGKPHIIQYLRKHLPQIESGVYKLKIHHFSTLFFIIRSEFTESFADRIQSIPEGYDHINIALPEKYAHMYLHQQHPQKISAVLEEYFWSKCIIYVLKKLQYESYTMDDALKSFAQEYEIYESIYPLGHFRRQMNRRQIKGVRIHQKQIEPKISRKLNNQQVKQMWRLKKKHPNLTYKQIGFHFGISRRYCQKLVVKFSENLSKKGRLWAA